MGALRLVWFTSSCQTNRFYPTRSLAKNRSSPQPRIVSSSPTNESIVYQLRSISLAPGLLLTPLLPTTIRTGISTVAPSTHRSGRPGSSRSAASPSIDTTGPHLPPHPQDGVRPVRGNKCHCHVLIQPSCLFRLGFPLTARPEGSQLQTNRAHG